MRSNKERIRLMHQRAAGLQRKKDKSALFAAGGTSAALFALLLSLTIYLQGLTVRYTGNLFTASSLLSESAGGYVLVAVLFFMIGVLISVLLIRYQRRKRHLNDSGIDDKYVEEGNDK